MIPRQLIQSAVGAVILLLLILLSLRSPQTQTREQIEYSKWFDDLKLQGRVVSAASKNLTPIRVRITSAIESIPLKWELVEESNGPLDERVFRILNLIEESQVNLTESPPSEPEQGSLLISVDSKDSKFGAVLSEREIRANLKLMNLLKVFEIYSQIPPKPAEAAPTTPPDYKLGTEPSVLLDDSNPEAATP